VDKILNKIVKAGEKYGKVTAVLNAVNQTSLVYDNGLLKNTVEGIENSLCIRLSKGNRFGYATTTDTDNWKTCLKNAVKVLMASKPLEQQISLSNTATKFKPIGVYSSRVKSISTAKLFKLGEKLLYSSKSYDKRIKIPSATITKLQGNQYFANSNGICVSEDATIFSATSENVIETSTGSDVKISHDIFNVAKIGKNAAEMCVNSINPKPVETGKMDLILDYFAFASLIEEVLVPALSADEVQSKKSFLCGKLGKKVFSENINITDDGVTPHGLFTGKIDMEGTPKQKTILVENGVVKNFMYDIYSAKKDKTNSTGNCMSLEKLPSVDPSNFIIEPGKLSREAIIESCSKGILAPFLFGTHVINSVTGDVSVGAENGFLIKNGKIVHPIKQAMVSFNLFEALKKIDALGNNQRQESSAVCPTIKLSNIQVVG